MKPIEINELWSMKLTPNDLYSIERGLANKPDGGDGQSYIQIAKKNVPNLLTFVGKNYSNLPINLEVHNFFTLSGGVERINLSSKSGGRMRFANQNRHRAPRLTAWSNTHGFPVLGKNDDTDIAEETLNQIGGVRLFLARSVNGGVYAGFTQGEADEQESEQPFAEQLWGSAAKGGYWSLKGGIV